MILFTLLISLCACVSPQHQGTALLAAKVRGPVWISGEPAPASIKVGRATTHTCLALFAYGDASVEAAMQDGGIRRVHHVDFESKSLLGGLFMVYTTMVYGE